MPLLHIGKYGDLRTLAWLVSAKARLRPFSTDPPAVPADRAGPPAMAGLHPGRGPGRPDRGPGHTPLAGRSNGPDRRPWSWGGEDHEATRPGKGGSRLLARSRLLSRGGPCRGPCGLLAMLPVRATVKHPRPGWSPARRSPTSGNCSRGTASNQASRNRPVPPRYEQALVGCMRVSARTTCCKSNDSRQVTSGAPAKAPRRLASVAKGVVKPACPSIQWVPFLLQSRA
jgi:hypothetical protein